MFVLCVCVLCVLYRVLGCRVLGLGLCCVVCVLFCIVWFVSCVRVWGLGFKVLCCVVCVSCVV